MEQSLQNRLDLFCENNKVLLKKYWFHAASLSMLASTVFTKNGNKADKERLKECHKILKKHFGVFSTLRGMMEIPLVAQMANAEDPEAYILKIGELYRGLKAGKFISSEFDVLCASILYEYKDKVSLEEIKPKMKQVYADMRAQHPLLTSSEDLAVALMIALSGGEQKALLDDMEACYQLLKPHFRFQGEEVQTMSALLCVQDGTPQEKCQWVLDFCEEMKQRKHSMKYSYALPVAAGLRSIGKTPAAMADIICEAADALKGKNGFGFLNLGKQGRIAFAMMMVMDDSAAKGAIAGTFLNATFTAIIMYQILLTIMIMIVMQSSMRSTTQHSH